MTNMSFSPFSLEFGELLSEYMNEVTKNRTKLHLVLKKYFQWNGCRWFEEFAERTLDIMLDMLMNEPWRIPTGVLPAVFMQGIASNLLKECHRRQKSRKSLVENLPDDERREQDRLSDDEDHYARMRKAFSKLERKQRKLLGQYYGDDSGAEARRKLAQAENTTELGLRLRVHKIRKELRQIYNSEK